MEGGAQDDLQKRKRLQASGQSYASRVRRAVTTSKWMVIGRYALMNLSMNCERLGDANDGTSNSRHCIDVKVGISSSTTLATSTPVSSRKEIMNSHSQNSLLIY